MDRRRFVPDAAELEGRQLLSTTAATMRRGPAPPAAVRPAGAVGARTQLIERLPNLLRSVQIGRFVPEDVVGRIQADLQAIKGELRTPGAQARNFFNRELRRRLSDASLGRDDALALNHALGVLLTAAGASAADVAALRADMDALAAVDAADVNPVFLATNDYAIVAGVALSVGRPPRTPGVPRLLGADDTGAKGDRATSVRQPRLSGAYDAGAAIQIVDAAGTVLGEGTVDNVGRYSVAFARPLPDGSITVSVRGGVDGVFSAPSRTITLTIGPGLPRGPRGLGF
jgi:hypothetical protein